MQIRIVLRGAFLLGKRCFWNYSRMCSLLWFIVPTTGYLLSFMALTRLLNALERLLIASSFQPPAGFIPFFMCLSWNSTSNRLPRYKHLYLLLIIIFRYLCECWSIEFVVLVIVLWLKHWWNGVILLLKRPHGRISIRWSNSSREPRLGHKLVFNRGDVSGTGKITEDPITEDAGTSASSTPEPTARPMLWWLRACYRRIFCKLTGLFSSSKLMKMKSFYCFIEEENSKGQIGCAGYYQNSWWVQGTEAHYVA